MEKREQRVIDLTKIDSKEKAFLAGYVCSLGLGWFKTSKRQLITHGIIQFYKYLSFDYNSGEKIITDELMELTDFFVNNFDATYEDKYTTDGTYPVRRVFTIYVTKESSSFLLNKLATVKKELYPYLVLGFYIHSGNYNRLYSKTKLMHSECIEIVGNINAINTLRKQLNQWYDIVSEDVNLDKFCHMTKKYKKQWKHMRIYGDDIIKFVNTFPSDYVELFKSNYKLRRFYSVI